MNKVNRVNNFFLKETYFRHFFISWDSHFLIVDTKLTHMNESRYH